MTTRPPAPHTKGRTIAGHAFAWMFVAVFPYMLVLTTAAFADTGDGFAEWFLGSLAILVLSLLIAGALCTLELGMLFMFGRARAIGQKARAIVPGVTIFLLALFLPSPALTALVPPSPTSIVPLAVVIAVAAALGIGVGVSHWRYSARHSPEMGPAGQD